MAISFLFIFPVAVSNTNFSSSNISAIKMYVKLSCPTGGCDEWDVYANVKVRDAASGELYELGRYITPYWNDNSQLDRGFEFDVKVGALSFMTGFFLSILTIGFWGIAGLFAIFAPALRLIV